MAKKLTPIEIIDDTVAYYSEDINRRALDNNRIYPACKYYMKEDGKVKKCAVGRCLKRGVAEKLEEDTKDDDQVINLVIANDNINWDDFKKKYQYPNIEFWTQLQGLHDDCSNWNKKGLTATGKKYVEDIKDFGWE